MFVAHAGNALGLGFTLDAIAAAGYRWVAVKAAHGLLQQNVSTIETLLDEVEKRGMRRAIWAWNEGDPAAEARFHASLAWDLRADVFIANPESSYEGVNAWKSRAYVEMFRTLHPDIVLGASVLGGSAIPAGSTLTPWAREFDVAPWLAAKADFLPQAYWNMPIPGHAPGDPRHDYRPVNCVHTWRLGGVPADRIHPTLGLWEVPSTVHAAQYLDDLETVEYGGLNTYLFEQYPVASEYRLIVER